MKWLILFLILYSCVNNNVSNQEKERKKNMLLPFVMTEQEKESQNNCEIKTTIVHCGDNEENCLCLKKENLR